MRMGPVLQQPGAAGLHPRLGHRHRLARAVDHLGAVERERADRLWVLPVGTADGADIASAPPRNRRSEPLRELRRLGVGAIESHNLRRDFRKVMFRKVTAAAGLGTRWVPKELRTPFVSM